MDLLNQFEELIKKRTVVFNYDEHDGYFIKVTGKGQFDHSVELAEMYPTKQHNIKSAIEKAIEWLADEDEKFRKLINSINT